MAKFLNGSTIGTVAIVLLGTGTAILGSMMQPLAQRVGTIEKANEAQDVAIKAHGDKNDHPIWHTLAIENLKEAVARVDQQSAARRDAMEQALDAHRDIEGHPEIAKQVISMHEKLREVETQFAHTDRLIQLLWQRVYQEPLPNPPAREP